MTSYSFNSPKGMLDNSDKKNDPQTKRNHWSLKLCVHIITIGLLVKILIIVSTIDLFMPLWIWIGSRIQANKYIVKESYKTYIILFTGMIIFYDYILIEFAIQTDMYHISSWIKTINNWFSGIP